MGGRALRTIKEATLVGFGLVDVPAYPDSTVALRSMPKDMADFETITEEDLSRGYEAQKVDGVMAITLTPVQLADAIRADSTDADVITLVTQKLAAASAVILEYAPNAPDAIHNEAAIRMIGFLVDAPFSGGAGSFINALQGKVINLDLLAMSGASGMMAAWRTHRAGIITKTLAAAEAAGNPIVEVRLTGRHMDFIHRDGTRTEVDIPTVGGGLTREQAQQIANAIPYDHVSLNGTDLTFLSSDESNSDGVSLVPAIEAVIQSMLTGNTETRISVETSGVPGARKLNFVVPEFNQGPPTLAEVYSEAKNIIRAGDNITLDRDDSRSTITINSSGGPGTGAASGNAALTEILSEVTSDVVTATSGGTKTSTLDLAQVDVNSLTNVWDDYDEYVITLDRQGPNAQTEIQGRFFRRHDLPTTGNSLRYLMGVDTQVNIPEVEGLTFTITNTAGVYSASLSASAAGNIREQPSTN